MSLQPNSLLEDHPDGTGDLNAIINGNWRKLNGYVNPAHGLTARLDDDTPPGAGSIINASGAVFRADDVGAIVFFLTDRINYTITSFTSATKVSIAAVTGEHLSQPFLLYRLGETERTAYMRGLTKLVRLIATDDKKLPRWNHTTQKCDLVDFPGFGAAAGRVLFGNGGGNDPITSADLVFDDSGDILDAPRLRAGKHFDTGFLDDTADANDGALQLDFNQEQYVDVNTLQANLTLSSANLAAGRWIVVRIVSDGSVRNLTFPGGWVFVGAAAPANIAANKTGLLMLRSYGTTDANVVARWLVQP
jgi:hypothetical protein